MNKKKITLHIAMGILFANGIFANNPNKDVEAFDINSVDYIEEEEEIHLGFNVADYLPEGFDPYKMYVDLNAIPYFEVEDDDFDFSENLPDGFDAYAYPSDVQSINYIDENDAFIVDFDTTKHLPEGFNPYVK